MRQRSPDWSGTARIGDAGITERTRAPTDDDREAALEGDDGIDSPPTDELIGNSVQVISELFAMAERKIQHGTKHKTLWNIESIEAPLVAEVVCVCVVPAHRAGFQPIDFRVGVVDKFRNGVRRKQLRPRGKALLNLGLF